ncbi:unnamed protein product [Jaminaea pallidilutea]
MLGSSAQSPASRRAILLSVAALALLCLPFARDLVSVKRLPIDRQAIARWQSVNGVKGTGSACPVLLPTSLRVEHLDHSDTQWAEAVKSYLKLWLEVASEGDAERFHPNTEKWCAQWHVTASGLQTDFSVSTKALRSDEGLQSYSSSSVALALARRAALELDLPFKHLLSHTASLPATAASDEIELPDPEPEDEPNAAGGATPTASSGAHASDVRGEPDVVEQRLNLPELWLPDDQAVSSQLEDVADRQDTGAAESSIALPSRLVLSLHVLNEDFGNSNSSSEAKHNDFLLAPLSSTSHPSSFVSALQEEFQDIHEVLEGVTEFGFRTHWALGAATKGVHWEKIEWQSEEAWEDMEEVTVTEEVEIEEENAVEEENAEQEKEDDDEQKSEQEDSAAHPLPSARRRRTQSVSRQEMRPITRRRPITRTVYALAEDQLEIFVDEGGWGLEEQHQQLSVGSSQFPSLYTASDKESVARKGSSEDTEMVKLVLYKPSPHHSPLIYASADVSPTDAQEARIAAAVEQEQRPVHWGWTVPGWGGIVIYNEKSSIQSNGTSGQLQTMSAENRAEVLRLWGEQVRALLGLPTRTTSHEPDAAKKRRLGQFNVLRRTLLARVRDSIESLAALDRVSIRLQSLEIGEEVQSRVAGALQCLQELQEQLQVFEADEDVAHHSLLLSSQHRRIRQSIFGLSSNASTLASTAFHHDRMLGLLYFPAEHTWAVYTPLFGPLLVPLLLATVKEIKRARKERRSRLSKTANTRQRS